MAATRELTGVHPLLLPCQLLLPDDELDGSGANLGESSPGPLLSSSLASGHPLLAGDKEMDVEVADWKIRATTLAMAAHVGSNADPEWSSPWTVGSLFFLLAGSIECGSETTTSPMRLWP
uniref:Uncharacterized protein n=1 Tax=Oryza punctata TaxID=4537 RepID=A0A0E0LJ72_ORYPU